MEDVVYSLSEKKPSEIFKAEIHKLHHVYMHRWNDADIYHIYSFLACGRQYD